MTDREVMQQALQALASYSVGERLNASQVNDLIAQLEAALEQPEQRKPLTIKEINAMPQAQGYWPIGMNDRIVRLIRAVEAAHGIKVEPMKLYTAPPAAQPEQIDQDDDDTQVYKDS